MSGRLTLEDCGRLDLADAYRRVADLAISAAARAAQNDSTPGDEDSAHLSVLDALLTVDQRRQQLAAARRGSARGRQAGAA